MSTLVPSCTVSETRRLIGSCREAADHTTLSGITLLHADNGYYRCGNYVCTASPNNSLTSTFFLCPSQNHTSI